MEKILFFVIMALGTACLGAVLYGLFCSVRQNRPEKAQALMRLRVILQALAVLLIVLLLFYSKL